MLTVCWSRFGLYVNVEVDDLVQLSHCDWCGSWDAGVVTFMVDFGVCNGRPQHWYCCMIQSRSGLHLNAANFLMQKWLLGLGETDSCWSTDSYWMSGASLYYEVMMWGGGNGRWVHYCCPEYTCHHENMKTQTKCENNKVLFFHKNGLWAWVPERIDLSKKGQSAAANLEIELVSTLDG